MRAPFCLSCEEGLLVLLSDLKIVWREIALCVRALLA